VSQLCCSVLPRNSQKADGVGLQQRSRNQSVRLCNPVRDVCPRDISLEVKSSVLDLKQLQTSSNKQDVKKKQLKAASRKSVEANQGRREAWRTPRPPTFLHSHEIAESRVHLSGAAEKISLTDECLRVDPRKISNLYTTQPPRNIVIQDLDKTE
jgi:hypothetical protein